MNNNLITPTTSLRPPDFYPPNTHPTPYTNVITSLSFLALIIILILTALLNLIPKYRQNKKYSKLRKRLLITTIILVVIILISVILNAFPLIAYPTD